MRTLLLFFISFYTYSQSLDVYIPMRTYHFNRDEFVLNTFHNTEGGNLGAVFILGGKDLELHLGVLRNSYGDVGTLYQFAYKVPLKQLKISLSVGLMTGYNKFYYYNDVKMFRGILKNNNILPTGSLNLTYTKYKIQPTIIISSEYINAGVVVRLFDNIN